MKETQKIIDGIKNVLQNKKNKVVSIENVNYIISYNDERSDPNKEFIFTPTGISGNYLYALEWAEEEIPGGLDENVINAIKNKKVKLIFDADLKSMFSLLKNKSKELNFKIETPIDTFLEKKSQVEILYNERKVSLNLVKWAIVSVISFCKYEDILENMLKSNLK
jgi:hypothetical protein